MLSDLSFSTWGINVKGLKWLEKALRISLYRKKNLLLRCLLSTTTKDLFEICPIFIAKIALVCFIV